MGNYPAWNYPGTTEPNLVTAPYDWENLTSNPAPGVTPTTATKTAAPGTDWGALWASLTGSNQMRYDEMVRQFNADLALRQKQLADQTAAGQRDAYSQLAQSLLSGAVSLDAPADWLRYAQYTNGGKNIFYSLFGNTPLALFQSPTGSSGPRTMEQVLSDLGLAGTGTGGGVTMGPGGVTQEQVNAWATGLNDDTARAKGMAFANTYGRLPASIDEWNAYKAGTLGAPQTAQQQTQTALDASTAAITGQNVPNPLVTDSTRTLASNTDVLVPQGYQVNPAVWDSLTPSAKQVILAALAAGRTTSGYQSAEDWLRALEMGRPGGAAAVPAAVSWGM